MKIVVVSGGFDPIHSGHIEYLKLAKSIGQKLIVALNSDAWLERKKGKFFMPFNERKTILESIIYVDEVINFTDDNVGSCINALENIKLLFPNDNIIFANGGDRNKSNIPEMTVKDIEFKFGVGGENKKNSSSWILKNSKYYNEERIWGSFFNLFEEDQIKVKELIVKAGKGMSFQRHFKRSEIWLVSHGSCIVNFSKGSKDDKEKITLNKFDHYLVPLGNWHQITNPFKEDCHIIEIQYGEACVEDDIERSEYYEPK